MYLSQLFGEPYNSLFVIDFLYWVLFYENS